LPDGFQSVPEATVAFPDPDSGSAQGRIQLMHKKQPPNIN
jgi:hypothetical protein